MTRVFGIKFAVRISFNSGINVGTGSERRYIDSRAKRSGLVN